MLGNGWGKTVYSELSFHSLPHLMTWFLPLTFRYYGMLDK